MWVSLPGPDPHTIAAILGALLIGMASLQGVIRLTWSRMPLAIPKDMEHIYSRIGNIEPGLFRALMKIGTVTKTKTPKILTREDLRPNALWFVVSGELILERDKSPAANLREGGFVGEIAWLRGGGASATVTLKTGAEVIEWRHVDLRRAARRSQRLELALDALIAQDLARKLAASTPLDKDSGRDPKTLDAALPV